MEFEFRLPNLVNAPALPLSQGLGIECTKTVLRKE